MRITPLNYNYADNKNSSKTSFGASIDVKPKQLVRLAKFYGQDKLEELKKALPQIKELAEDDVSFSIRFKLINNPLVLYNNIGATLGRIYIHASTVLPNGKKIIAKDYNWLSDYIGDHRPKDTLRSAQIALKKMDHKKYNYWEKSIANPEINNSIKEIEAIASNKITRIENVEANALAELTSLAQEFDKMGINGNEFVMERINSGSTIADVRAVFEGLKNSSTEAQFAALAEK